MDVALLELKQRDVGLTRGTWDAVAVQDVCRLINGRGFKPYEWGNRGLPIIRIQNLNGSDDFNYYSGEYNPKILVETGQLLFAWSGSRGTSFGPHIWRGPRALLNYHTWKVVVDECAVDKHFLYHALRHLTAQIEESAHGASALVHTQKGEMEKFTVLVPPLPEQRAIAEALNDVDALLAALERVIAKKRDLRLAAMQQLLTGQTRLPGFDGEWEVKSIFDLAGRQKAQFDDGDWIEAEFLTESGVRLIQTGNIGQGEFIDRETRKYISEETFKVLNCKALETGDILICRLAEPAGRACLLPELGEKKIITAVDVTIFRPPATVADRRFLVHLFNTPRWLAEVSERCGGSTRTRIARGQLGRIELQLPSPNEQTAIATVLSDMDTELAAFEQRRDKTRALKQAMMQELLTGKTRLVPPEARPCQSNHAPNG